MMLALKMIVTNILGVSVPSKTWGPLLDMKARGNRTREFFDEIVLQVPNFLPPSPGHETFEVEGG